MWSGGERKSQKRAEFKRSYLSLHFPTSGTGEIQDYCEDAVRSRVSSILQTETPRQMSTWIILETLCFTPSVTVLLGKSVKDFTSLWVLQNLTEELFQQAWKRQAVFPPGLTWKELSKRSSLLRFHRDDDGHWEADRAATGKSSAAWDLWSGVFSACN